MAPRVSFEFFPPKSVNGAFELWNTAQSLMEFMPEFVSVTCGAKGQNKAPTIETLGALKKRIPTRVVGHLTATGQTDADIAKILNGYGALGVNEIVALMGDKSANEKRTKDEIQSSVELVKAVAKTKPRNIYVGAYPEPHPNSKSFRSDMDWLKKKEDAGATAAITQFAFKAETYLKFRDKAADSGINIPIIPGILPIANWDRAKAMAIACNTQIPQRLDDGFKRAERDGREELLALSHAVGLCDALISGGFEHLHFYTLNRASMSGKICDALGVQRRPTLARVA